MVVVLVVNGCERPDANLVQPNAASSLAAAELGLSAAGVPGCVVQLATGAVVTWRTLGPMEGAETDYPKITSDWAAVEDVTICGQRLPITAVASFRLVETGRRGNSVPYLRIMLAEERLADR
jgi:hypothetical protein